MTKQEIIDFATNNAHAMWVSDESLKDDWASEEEFTEAMIQNAFDDFVGFVSEI